MNWLAILVSILVLIVLLSPFFLGAGGVLAAASAENSREKLQSLKSQLLKQYISDESAASEGHMSQREWVSRKQFITNRYIDAARRLDYLQSENTETRSK